MTQLLLGNSIGIITSCMLFFFSTMHHKSLELYGYAISILLLIAITFEYKAIKSFSSEEITIKVLIKKSNSDSAFYFAQLSAFFIGAFSATSAIFIALRSFNINS
ncbi:hypothetical protein [Pseudomonas sp. XK-1]|uniref:hypothetical protein n=1 Tax=Pseudomonas sp. XK-1 TaxID=3136019 RepID=UPI0031193BB0